MIAICDRYNLHCPLADDLIFNIVVISILCGGFWVTCKINGVTIVCIWIDFNWCRMNFSTPRDGYSISFKAINLVVYEVHDILFDMRISTTANHLVFIQMGFNQRQMRVSLTILSNSVFLIKYIWCFSWINKQFLNLMIVTKSNLRLYCHWYEIERFIGFKGDILMPVLSPTLILYRKYVIIRYFKIVTVFSNFLIYIIKSTN